MENISAGVQQFPKWEHSNSVSHPVGILMTGLSTSTKFSLPFLGLVQPQNWAVQLGCQGPNTGRGITEFIESHESQSVGDPQNHPWAPMID